MEIAKLFTQKKTLIFFIIVLLIVCGVLLYAISRDAEISFSKDKWLTICPKGNERIEELEKKLAESIPLSEHKKLEEKCEIIEKEYDEVSSKYSKILQIVGADAKDGGKEALEKITLLSVRYKEFERNVKYSLTEIQNEVHQNRTINTNSVAIDQTTRDLYMHIQKFLRSIGIYNGSINGDQNATCTAVKQFQMKYGLNDDGIVGPKTLELMEIVFEEAKKY